MLKAWARNNIALLFALIFGIQATALSFHETRHAAASADQKHAQSISADADDCSQCAAQHSKLDATAVQLEPTETGIPPVALDLLPIDRLISFVRVFSQPRAPPVA